MKKLLILLLGLWCFSIVYGQELSSYITYSDMSTRDSPVYQSGNLAAECEGQRDDISELEDDDQILLAQLILEYLTSVPNPSYNEATDPIYLKYDVIAAHSNYGGNANAWHSDNEMFFSWHRDYIQGLENWLLANGHSNFVPLPGWNPNQSIPSAFEDAVVPEILNTTLFGSSMELNEIEEGELEMYTVDDIACEQFENMDDFAEFIRSNGVVMAGDTPIDPDFDSHNVVHGTIGGAMGAVPTASAAAIFWLFHAHVDDLYHCYQTRCQNCEPVFIRPIPRVKDCTYCFDLSQSVEVQDVGFSVVRNGTTFNIMLDENGCIDIKSQSPSLIAANITMNITASNECSQDEVNLPIQMPLVSDNDIKNGRSCIMTAEIPSPIRQNINIEIQNLTADAHLSIMKADVFTGGQEEIQRPILLRQEEVFSIDYDTSRWISGVHAIVIQLGEHTYVEKIIKE